MVLAANNFGRFFTGQITAAGKVPPAKVTVNTSVPQIKYVTVESVNLPVPLCTWICFAEHRSWLSEVEWLV